MKKIEETLSFNIYLNNESSKYFGTVWHRTKYIKNFKVFSVSNKRKKKRKIEITYHLVNLNFTFISNNLLYHKKKKPFEHSKLPE